MDCSLAGCARNSARQDVACRLGVNLPTHTMKNQLQSNKSLQREIAIIDTTPIQKDIQSRQCNLCKKSQSESEEKGPVSHM